MRGSVTQGGGREATLPWAIVSLPLRGVRPNQAVQRIAAGALLLQCRVPEAAAIAHFIVIRPRARGALRAAAPYPCQMQNAECRMQNDVHPRPAGEGLREREPGICEFLR